MSHSNKKLKFKDAKIKLKNWNLRSPTFERNLRIF